MTKAFGDVNMADKFESIWLQSKWYKEGLLVWEDKQKKHYLI